MAFKVQARTLLHLGAELISSDAIALFELIKNAFDAGSRDVTIDVIVRLPDWPGNYPVLMEAARKGEVNSLNELRAELLQHYDAGAPNADSWAESVRHAGNPDELCRLAKDANSIKISDTGHGMSLVDLDEIYLTIGTRHRLEERKARHETAPNEGKSKERPILGEKGLGRLSAMRLGNALQVETARQGEDHWNLLEIDWNAFAHAIDQLIDDVEVTPKIGRVKAERETCGTTILISDLRAHWDEKRLAKYAAESASKLTDPFSAKRLYKVNLRLNGGPVKIDRLDTDMLKIAQASVEAYFRVTGTHLAPELRLEGVVSYMSGERVRHFAIDDLTHLRSTTEVSPGDAWRLGPFTMCAYWFNRQALRERKPDGPELVKWVKNWSGGLMLFRDGFRVHPYGEPDDDWLDLDGKALASAGYKVNRKQLIGKVDITSSDNPSLTDQTNREGLHDCPEKQALIALLKEILEQELRSFLNELESEKRAALDLDLDQLTARAAEEREKLAANFTLLKARHREICQEREIISAMESAITELESTLAATKALAGELREGRTQLVHLAGLGLMVEMLAHELNRSTQYALSALDETKKREGTPVSPALSNLEIQLRTLQGRLKALDPATTSGRQRKESFDLVQLAKDIAEGHEAGFRRHAIKCEVKTVPRDGRLPVKMVKGMVVQVLENLIDNSFYWLKQRAMVDRSFIPQLSIEVDVASRQLRVTDNGPGVLASFKDRVFLPFFTTKPPGQGKGLGLFIARDVARYHDATLTLSEEQRVRPGHFNTFTLSLPKDADK